MSDDGDVTQWIDRMAQGDQQAIGRIWEHDYRPLIAVLATTHLVDGFGGELHDMKTIVNDLVLSQRDGLLRGLYVGRTHVHRDRLHRDGAGKGEASNYRSTP